MSLSAGVLSDPFGAFCRDNHVGLRGSEGGALAGMSFAIKDVFDVAGSRTGFGQPDWLATHPPATETSPLVQRLLDSGADLAGRTICDEMCYSLTGENVHYGIPANPVDRSRIPGGSSSGSASATAGGLVDFALGTDCGGSVRIPASYCGLYGIRPTHGRVPVEGLVPFAPGFDCVGWFARAPEVLARVGRVLISDDAPAEQFSRVLIARDAFEAVDGRVAEALSPAVEAVGREIGEVREVTLAPEGLEAWFETFRVLQAGEIWATHGEWIERTGPRFGPGVSERMAWARQVTEAQMTAARTHRRAVVARLREIIGPGDVVVLPSAPRAAPYIGERDLKIETNYRYRAMWLLCAAGLGGLPQVSLPIAEIDGLPLGLSVMARAGTDSSLLDLARRVGRPAVSPSRMEGVR